MEELPGGLRRVTMPLPSRPGHVHCYLLPVDDGFMLVDTGLGLPDAAELWAAELEQLPAPVTTIFVTHFHPDHLGATADVRDLTGARVVQGALDAEQSAMTWGNEEWSIHLADWFRRNGVPDEVTEELLGQGERFRPFIRPVLDPELVDDGDRLHGWEIVAAPGHADGQLTLLKDGVLIAADHLLARITPTVGLWPASRPDPLGDYLGSLQRTIDLAPDDRLRRPRRHRHRPGRPGQRAARPSRRAARSSPPPRSAREPRTAYEVSFPLFGDDLRPAARRFAVAETLSHLERLVRDGGAERHELQPNGDVASVSYTAAQ